MKKKKNSFFTLLEICICLMILSLVAGILGVQIQKALIQSRFENAVSRFAIELRKWQILAMSYHTDLEIFLFQDKEQKIAYQVLTDDSLPMIDSSKQYELSSVDFLTWNQKKISSCRLKVLHTGRFHPLCIIGLHREIRSDEKKEFWIDLRYPLQIKIDDHYPSKRNLSLPKIPE